MYQGLKQHIEDEINDAAYNVRIAEDFAKKHPTESNKAELEKDKKRLEILEQMEQLANELPED